MAFCSSCGSQVDQGTRFCPKCGRPVADAAPLAQTPPPAAPATYAPPGGTIYAGPAVPAYAPAPVTTHYGGFWIRFVAHLVDGLIVGIPLTAIIVVIVMIFGAGSLATLKSLSSNSDPEQVQAQIIPIITALIGAYAVFFAVAIAISWLYYALMESSERQATFGKAILNLRVADVNGNRLSFGHASGRFFSKIVTYLVPFAIGWIMAGFTAKKQALHDFIAGTLVIKTN
jgi:uncharacterized RDD family membrane protein YckC